MPVGRMPSNRRGHSRWALLPVAALLQCADPGKFYVLSEVDARSLDHDELALFLPDDDVQDFTVADGQIWVTRHSSSRLARVDLATGVVRESVDFSAYADADGNPDLGTLLAHDGRLYVQIRRYNADEPWRPSAACSSSRSATSSRSVRAARFSTTAASS